MPNGNGKAWTPRRPNNETLWKLLGIIFVPVIMGLGIAVAGLSQDMSAAEVKLDRAEETADELHEIDNALGRLEERQLQQQKANDDAHERLLEGDRDQNEKLDRILQRLGR